MIICFLGTEGSLLYPSVGSSRFLLCTCPHHFTLFSYAYRLNNTETPIHHFAWSNETGKCGLPRGRKGEWVKRFVAGGRGQFWGNLWGWVGCVNGFGGYRKSMYVIRVFSTRLSVRVDFVAKGCVSKRNKRKSLRVGICNFPIYSYCNVTVIFALPWCRFLSC